MHMDELTQCIRTLAALDEREVAKPGGVSCLTTVIAARLLLELAEDGLSDGSSEAAQRALQRSIDHADHAALILAGQ
jgi:hypothetical protein